MAFSIMFDFNTFDTFNQKYQIKDFDLKGKINLKELEYLIFNF